MVGLIVSYTTRKRSSVRRVHCIAVRVAVGGVVDFVVFCVTINDGFLPYCIAIRITIDQSIVIRGLVRWTVLCITILIVVVVVVVVVVESVVGSVTDMLGAGGEDGEVERVAEKVRTPLGVPE